LFVSLLVALLPLYALLPPGRLRVREVLPGALVAATGWVLLRFGFELYAVYAAEYQVYGVLGALLLFITWLYIGALTVLIGAVVNVVVRESRL
jgi:membrane protein